MGKQSEKKMGVEEMQKAVLPILYHRGSSSWKPMHNISTVQKEETAAVDGKGIANHTNTMLPFLQQFLRSWHQYSQGWPTASSLRMIASSWTLISIPVKFLVVLGVPLRDVSGGKCKIQMSHCTMSSGFAAQGEVR